MRWPTRSPAWWARCAASASAWRRSSTASTTGLSCSTRPATSSRRTTPSWRAREGGARRCSGPAVRTRRSAACNVGECPTSGCLASGQRQVRLCERTAADGSVRWEEIHASPIADARGRVTHVVEVWRDISDRRAAEASLAESHKLASLGLLASGFSHELNTPLATVLTCVEGILRDARLLRRGRSRRDAPHRRERGDRARADPALPRRHPALPADGARPVVPRRHRGPGRRGARRRPGWSSRRRGRPASRSTVDAPADGLRVRADEASLQHAVINLLLNAVQACQRGGSGDASAPAAATRSASA